MAEDVPYDVVEDQPLGVGASAGSVAQMLPDFTTAVRGYDRAQVDEYITRLHDWLAEAEERARLAEAANAAATEHAQTLGRQLVSLERQSGLPTAHAMASYMDKMKQIMVEALEAAQGLRDDAFDEGDAIRQVAQGEGQEIVARARSEATQVLKDVQDEDRELRQQIRGLIATREKVMAELEELQTQLGQLLRRPVRPAPAGPEPEAGHEPGQSTLPRVVRAEGSAEGPLGDPPSDEVPGEAPHLFDQEA